MIIPKIGDFYTRRLDNAVVKVVDVDDNTVYCETDENDGLIGCNLLLWNERFIELDVDNQVVKHNGIF